MDTVSCNTGGASNLLFLPASSSNQPCSYCNHHTAHAYFESMDPDTDTESDDADMDDGEEYQSLVNA
eukprot:3757612-Prorocentrum_lima.AAC.1